MNEETNTRLGSIYCKMIAVFSCNVSPINKMNAVRRFVRRSRFCIFIKAWEDFRCVIKSSRRR